MKKINNERVITNKMDLLNSFKDHEVLNAFKLSLINTDMDDNSYNSDIFYENVAKNFIKLLRQKADSSDDSLVGRMDKMNIQSDNAYESSVISDFGDIIPVNFEEPNKGGRKHQKWTIGEQKKLTSLLNNKPINEITEYEWNNIAQKLDRTKTSVFYKSKELTKRAPNVNKKRKVMENPLSNVNDTLSSISMSRQEREFNTDTIQSEPDIFVEEASRDTKSDCLFISRKKAISTVLEEMPGR